MGRPVENVLNSDKFKYAKARSSKKHAQAGSLKRTKIIHSLARFDYCPVVRTKCQKHLGLDLKEKFFLLILKRFNLISLILRQIKRLEY